MLLLNVPLLATAFTLMPLGLDADCSCRKKTMFEHVLSQVYLHMHQAMCAWAVMHLMAGCGNRKSSTTQAE